MEKYTPVIGLEIHVELKTRTKMFCSCENDFGLESKPNIHICPVCTGQPGTLPAINKEAVEKVIKTGLALNGQIQSFSKFDRKNYFYPDLPKGYQISQYDKPLVSGGYLEIKKDETEIKRIKITRIHLEEDTGKLIHPPGADYSLVDLNRAGVPLMELVTEPDISSGKEARIFCEELQLILRYLDVSDADMERGQMRCEVNISLKQKDDKLGTKVEIKNLNSFKTVERSIDYEIKRQAEALDFGEKIIQETRGWDEGKQATISQREKEEAHDYRYFPEPDLPPLQIGTGQKLDPSKIEIPEMPNEKRERFKLQYNLSDLSINILVEYPVLGRFFEESASELQLTEYNKSKFSREEFEKLYKLLSNYVITEFPKYIGREQKKIDKPSPENFAELIILIFQGQISSSVAQTVLAEMFETGADPTHIIKEKRLEQISDFAAIEEAAKKIIKTNSGPVAEYRNGKTNVLQFLVGQVMKETKGKANPQIAREILEKLLNL